MKAMFIRDFINYKTVFITIAILIPIGYFMTLPPFHISLGMLLPVLFIGVFYSDYRSHIHHFVQSLPISRKTIVQTRYASMLATWIGIVFYQLIIGHLLEHFLPYPVFTFGWKEIITLFSLGLVMLALFLPMYFGFTSFIIPTIIFAVSYFTVFYLSLDALVNISGMNETIMFNYLDQWIVPLIETVIPYQPFIIIPIIGIILTVLSMILSINIMQEKEI